MSQFAQVLSRIVSTRHRVSFFFYSKNFPQNSNQLNNNYNSKRFRQTHLIALINLSFSICSRDKTEHTELFIVLLPRPLCTLRLSRIFYILYVSSIPQPPSPEPPQMAGDSRRNNMDDKKEQIDFLLAFVFSFLFLRNQCTHKHTYVSIDQIDDCDISNEIFGHIWLSKTFLWLSKKKVTQFEYEIKWCMHGCWYDESDE